MKKLVSVLACFAWTTVGVGQIDVYRKQLESNPRDALAHFRIAEILLSQNNYQSAANEFRSAINGESPAPWLVESARLNLEKISILTGRTGAGHQPPVPMPEPLGRVQADYTDEARLAGLEGIVVVSGILDEDGTLQDLRAEQALGLGLDDKALEAVSRWRYTGEPLEERALVHVAAEFTLPEKKSRWHLTSVAFQPPNRASRPAFARVPYPIGAGIAREAVAQGRFVIAVGRSAAATVSFDIGPHGKAANFKILSQSEETWGPQAVGLVSEWEFRPGMIDGIAVTVPCTMTLVWGERSIPARVLSQVAIQEEQPPIAANFVPEVRYRPDPVYSPEAIEARREGTVGIALVVALDGTPRDLRVVQPLGFGLDERALEAVSKWRFAPALFNGQPAPMPAVVEVPFRLPAQ